VRVALVVIFTAIILLKKISPPLEYTVTSYFFTRILLGVQGVKYQSQVSLMKCIAQPISSIASQFMQYIMTSQDVIVITINSTSTR